MPTYVLEGTAPVRLTRGAVSVHISATGAPVVTDATSPAGPVAVIRPAPHLLVIPRLDGRTVIRIAHADGGVAFPAGSSVALTLGVDRPGVSDPDRVMLPAVDVSGLLSRDLVELDGDGASILVRALGTHDESPLPELASRARAAARQVLGVDRVPAAQEVMLVVAMDGSASVRRLAGTGAVDAVLDVLRGIARVIALDGEVTRVALVGDTTSWVGAGAGRTPLEAAVAELRAAPAEIGFRSVQPGLRRLAPDENVVVYVITDEIPTDVLALDAEGDVEGEARHLVVLAPGGRAPAPTRTSLPVTPLDLPLDTDLADVLLRTPERLVQLVHSLLSGCFAPGTVLAEKVRR